MGGRLFYEKVGHEFVAIDSQDICEPYNQNGFNFGRVLEQLVFLLIIGILTGLGIYLKHFLKTFTCVWRRRSSLPFSADSRTPVTHPLLSADPNKRTDHGDTLDSRLERVSSRTS
ncbi:hypothetical protein V3C99_002865, partial [Haemonchus contortus]